MVLVIRPTKTQWAQNDVYTFYHSEVITVR